MIEDALWIGSACRAPNKPNTCVRVCFHFMSGFSGLPSSCREMQLAQYSLSREGSGGNGRVGGREREQASTRLMPAKRCRKRSDGVSARIIPSLVYHGYCLFSRCVRRNLRTRSWNTTRCEDLIEKN